MENCPAALQGDSVKTHDQNPFPPSTIELKCPLRYSPLAYLDSLQPADPPLLAFEHKDSGSLEHWRAGLRRKLWELLGEPPHLPAPQALQSRKLSSEQCSGFTREKWEIDVADGRSMPLYVLVPHQLRGNRTVICLHGHGDGAKDIVGLPVNDQSAALIRTLNTDYAVQCAQRGWTAIAPELFGFGERVDRVDGAREGFDGGCEKPSLNAIQLGRTLAGLRLKDVCVLIDWIAAVRPAALEELACIGLSGGGMLCMYAAALDQRIKRALIAGYLSQMRGSILAIRHCSCNYVPRLALWADFPDIAGLIAPRRLIVQAGRRDAIFPIESARAAYRKVQRIYQASGAADNLRLDEHNGFHQFWSPSLDRLFG